jgi:hypothetical protein
MTCRATFASIVGLVILCEIALPRGAAGWGAAGHELVTRAAVAAADGLPAWFRDEATALAEQSNAPDRWRDLDEEIPALAARRADHFFDLDVWGEAPLPADRWRYARRARERRLAPEAIGALPFAILEEYGVLIAAFRDVRTERAGGRVAALVAAAVLAHLVGDAAVPLHATRHHHGWVGENPRGFTRSPGVHRWFETELVAGFGPGDVRPGPDTNAPLSDVPAAVHGLIRDSLAQVTRLYEGEGQSRAGDTGAAQTLARERLAAGATMLARLWRSAWERSAG